MVVEKEYWVFWTYCANFANHPRKVFANSPEGAIARAYGGWFTEKEVRYLVFEVGGDLVWDGVCPSPCTSVA